MPCLLEHSLASLAMLPSDYKDLLGFCLAALRDLLSLDASPSTAIEKPRSRRESMVNT